jgi:hypothetical protein
VPKEVLLTIRPQLPHLNSFALLLKAGSRPRSLLLIVVIPPKHLSGGESGTSTAHLISPRAIRCTRAMGSTGINTIIQIPLSLVIVFGKGKKRRGAG